LGNKIKSMAWGLRAEPENIMLPVGRNYWEGGWKGERQKGAQSSGQRTGRFRKGPQERKGRKGRSGGEKETRKVGSGNEVAVSNGKGGRVKNYYLGGGRNIL